MLKLTHFALLHCRFAARRTVPSQTCSSLPSHSAVSAVSSSPGLRLPFLGLFEICRAMSASTEAAAIPPLQKFPVPEAQTPLAIAARDGQLDVLSAASVDELNTPDANKNTAIVWATEGGQMEAVKLLLSKGVDVNHRGFLGNSALHRAARNGHAEIAKLLLETEGIQPNHPNDKQQYAMHFAAFQKKMEVIKVMLAAGMDTTVVDRKGRTPAEDTSDPEIRDAILKAREAVAGKV
uniref:Uncharacterized protein n=1 Tax=Chromera velia CCMP2878 TaxID=1169474 RepID=A0A0G4FXS7_9ALVE|mmetsp:Transcript_7946/g.15475  ORF Transcript_7946/g.15475 Transcript_7946/m.15475 type:complete len:236 (+) Transcript_7946:3-710(+)|eukprot:Cvel_19314.t1-p1 / transcript=Cvel_19314.t1 / gene=Cvel_19314 / organism=Chromera_velia_CCMP2878 / gene_product=Ankyrin repeat and KH domain-containing protein, putative / transcript_product=Ankyrin repeat and KH domain-containing protein, putative / location=Cvel_scaffold1655:31975-32679(-) / protein_length=235 / sequence_SO=supercontig / SO=protein_coding / is_pseudo=false